MFVRLELDQQDLLSRITRGPHECRFVLSPIRWILTYRQCLYEEYSRGSRYPFDRFLLQRQVRIDGLHRFRRIR